MPNVNVLRNEVILQLILDESEHGVEETGS